MKTLLVYFFCLVGFFQASGQNCPDVVEMKNLTDTTYLKQIAKCPQVKIKVVYLNYIQLATFTNVDADIIQATDINDSNKMYYIGFSGSFDPKKYKQGQIITLTGHINIIYPSVTGYKIQTYLIQCDHIE